MKTKLLLFLNLFLLIPFLSAQIATAPSVGDGTSGNPYQISSLENLYWLTQNSAQWSNSYIQTADIDAYDSKTWDGGLGFSPIGNTTTPFVGNFDGQNYKISNIYINRPLQTAVGVFGYINATGTTGIKNIHVKNIYVKGGTAVGGIFGSIEVNVSKCHSSGIVVGNANVGGVAGAFIGATKTMSKCFSSCDVIAGYECGGLVGRNTGTVSNSFALGIADGTGFTGMVGGLVGKNDKWIYTSYAAGNVLPGTTRGVAGFFNPSTSFVNQAYWDTQTTGQTSSQGSTSGGLATANMKKQASFVGFTFSPTVWSINEDASYPYLTELGVPCLLPKPVTAIQIANVSANSFDIVGWSSVVGSADGFVVYINDVDAFNYPVDGITPATNSVWQASGQQCVYTGSSSSPNISITNTSSSSTYFVKVYAYNDCQNGRSYEIVGSGATVTPATAIGKIKNSKFTVYPNPTESILFLNGGDSEIKELKLVDVIGNVIFESSNLAEISYSIDLSDLKGGIFILKYSTNKESGIIKVIKR